MNIERETTHITIYKPKIIGSFFLLAFLAYGFGQNLFGSDVLFEKFIGALLMITNSILVVFIGIFLRKTLQKYNIVIGNIYFFSRVFEAIALVSIVMNLLPGFNISMDYGYLLGMLVLGIGSVPMCLILYKHQIIPRWLALWGVIGYSIFAFGFVMELFGKKWSMYLLGLGGLWEVIFAIWLIIKGNKLKQE